ncbi:Alpha/beta hydrolase family protein [Enhygromyxa salina]|uniref:Palmitoyl-protein thioesterase ABHD10, mitochondrial n=1 Tax=Enhygromyxa salina TaxID=215803 RepID=A0A2S9XBN8_9BACT|nr:YqiA/YcfP family alpha/beta fold hydrolase [Enhygromyxa salina]PRP90268.1 Alpha/beta hydrolase family protein [Enhygromyxa salina]
MTPIRHAYLHGFASSNFSRKGQALRRFYAEQGRELHTPNLNAPSFAELTYTSMLGALDEFDRALDEREGSGPEPARWRFVGSSMGGYLAARWAQLHPERVDRLILLCPAFDFVARWPTLIGPDNFERWRERGHMSLPDGTGTPVDVHFGLVEDAMTHPPRPIVTCPTVIIHGTRDTIVPIESSRSYAQAQPQVRLVEVDDDHLLANSLETIEAHALRELIAPKPTLYWDFFGPTAQGTAEHFHGHLDEFLAREGFADCETGVEGVEPGRHVAAWCRCPEELVSTLGRALRPRRVE